MNLNQVMTELDNLFTQERISEVPQFLEEHIEQARTEGAQDIMLTLYNECIGFYRETGQYDKAMENGNKAMALMDEMGLGGTMPYATTLLNIANAQRAAGHLQESLELYNKVRPIYVARLKEDDMYFAGLYNNLSLLYQEMGDFAAAKEQLENALEIVRHKENTAFEIAVTQANLANTCIELGQDDEAKTRAEEAIRIFEEIGVDDAHYSAALSALGSLYYMDKDYPNALETMEKSRECVAKYLGTENIQYQRLSDNIAIIKEKMGEEPPVETPVKEQETNIKEDKAPMDEEEIDKILGIDIDNDGWASVIRADKKSDEEKDDSKKEEPVKVKEEDNMEEKEVFNPAESVSTFNITSAFAEIKAAAAQKLQARNTAKAPAEELSEDSPIPGQETQTSYDEEKAVDAMIAEVMDEIAVEVEEVSEEDRPKASEPEVEESEESKSEEDRAEESEPEEDRAEESELEEDRAEESELEEDRAEESELEEGRAEESEPEEDREEESEPEVEESEESEPEEGRAEENELEEDRAEESESESEESEETGLKEEQPEEHEAEADGLAEIVPDDDGAEETVSEDIIPEEEVLEDSDADSNVEENVLEETQLDETYEDLTPEITGLELCRRYYEEFGKPMIADKFPEYEAQIAVGLVGKGSDCFGFDDIQSRDHDFGPRFLLWVTKEVYDKVGSALEAEYEKLADTFMGVKRVETFHGKDRAGVMVIEDFYKNTLGVDLIGVLTSESKGLTQVKSWLAVHDYGLAAAVNGAVFRDDEGIFTSYRELLKGYYPKAVWYRKIAQACALFSQNGQYNLPRMRKRGQLVAAELAKAECVKQAMKLTYLLNKKYAPHDKWLFKNLPDNPDMVLEEPDLPTKSVAQLAEEISLMPVDKAHETQLTTAVESLAVIFANELERQKMIGNCDLYLDANTAELIAKSDALLAATMADAPTITALSLSIAKAEFEAFDKVRNEGGRASCQNNWPTFKVMRMSQYMTWDEDMLLQYLYEFKTNLANGRNMIEEKYARMMASTAPDAYAEFADKLPEISEEKRVIMEQIIGLQVKWMEEFAKEYPGLAGNARTIHTAEDLPYDTSYETYLRGELGTYSDKLLEMYGRYIVEYAQSGKSIAREIMANTIKFYGYKSFEEAESRGI